MLAVAALAAGCSGGGRTGSLPVGTVSSGVASQTPALAGYGAVTLSFNAAASGVRRAAYLTDRTLYSVSVGIDGGALTAYPLNSSRTATIPLAPGTHQLVVALLQRDVGADGGGAAGTGLAPLTIAKSSVSIAPGTATALSVTLNGVPSSFATFFPYPGTYHSGVAASIVLSNFAVHDANGSVITPPGGFANANGDAISVTIAANNPAFARTVLAAPTASPITVAYGGGASTGAVTLQATAPGAASGIATIVPTQKWV